MENAEITQVEDLRQSPKWGEYLAWLGWKSVRTTRDINVEILKTLVGGLAKVQRPKVLTEEDLEEIKKICFGYKPLFIKIEPNYFQEVEVLEKNKYKKSFSPLAPPSTMYIDLGCSESALWEKISKSGKYSIRHSKSHTEFFKNPSEEVLQKLYSLFVETSKKQKFTVQSFADLKKKAEVFGDECFAALGFDQNNNLTGGKFFLAHKTAVWYLHAGTTAVGRASNVGDKMMWDSILYFKGLNFKTMDLEGIDDPRFPMFTRHWGGFSFFKEKFGGIVVRFPHSYTYYINPFLKVVSKLRTMPF